MCNGVSLNLLTVAQLFFQIESCSVLCKFVAEHELCNKVVELTPLQVLQTMLQCLFFVDIRDALIRHWPDNQPITD